MKAPQSVSFVQPLISRGEEIKSADPVVSYYCFFAAVGQVLETKLHTQDPEVAEFATSLLNDIESMKAGIDSQLLEDDDASRAHVLNFASLVYAKSVRATETHSVTRATAAGFSAAAVFLGLESIWGEIDPDTAEKIKYAKYQAIRILKAIKNGEDPNDLFEPEPEPELEPATEQEEQELEPQPEKEEELGAQAQEDIQPNELEPQWSEKPVNEEVHERDAEIGAASEEAASEEVELPEPPRANPESDLELPHAPRADPENDITLPPPPESKPEGNVSPPPPAPPKREPNYESRRDQPQQPPQKPQKPAPPIPKKQPQESTPVGPVPSKKPSMSPAEIIQLTSLTGTAQKHAKYAISALNYDDIGTAISQLEQALKLLKTYENDK